MPPGVLPLRRWLSPSPGGARGGDNVTITCAAGAVHFVLALVAVGALIPWKGDAGLGLQPAPWGDVLVLSGGVVAAMAAARAIAFSPSLLRAMRTAFTAHGLAAIATTALCAALLANTPPPRRPTPELAGAPARTLYVRAVDPFFLPQLALGLGTALLFRGLTAAARRNRASAPFADEGRSPWMLATVSGVCYLAVVAYGNGGPGDGAWFHPDASRYFRFVVIVGATPVLMGVLAAAASAGVVARSNVAGALAWGLVVHLVAAAISRALVGLTWMAFRFDTTRSGGAAVMDALSTVARAEYFTGAWRLSLPGHVDLMAQTLAGAAAALLFWFVAPRRARGIDAPAPAPEGAPPPRFELSNDVPLVCASAALFAVPAWIMAFATMVGRGPEDRFSALSSIAWVHLCIVGGGSLAAAAVARALAFGASGRLALVRALVAHALAALVTVGFCAAFIARLPPGAEIFQFQERDGSRQVETFDAPFAESAGGLALRQLAIGMLAAAAFRRLAEGLRLRRSILSTDVRARRDASWPGERKLAALGAACFLIVSASVLYPFVSDDVFAVPSHARDARRMVFLAFPLLTGTLAAAASAGAIARFSNWKAFVMAAAVHLYAGVATVGVVTLVMAAGDTGRREGPNVLTLVPVLLWYLSPLILGVIAAQAWVGVVATLVFTLVVSARSTLRRFWPPGRTDALP